MSILIKGLALPNNCHMCFFGYGGFCDVAPAEEDGICPPQGRPTWCPLIELPPHGRLIDADALPMNKDCPRVEWEDIVNAPTIIEAEGEDG